MQISNEISMFFSRGESIELIFRFDISTLLNVKIGIVINKLYNGGSEGESQRWENFQLFYL